MDASLEYPMPGDDIKDWIAFHLEDYEPPPALGFSKWIFPVIKNIMAHDILKDIIELQPMMQPTADIFYLDLLQVAQPVEQKTENLRVGGANPSLGTLKHSTMAVVIESEPRSYFAPLHS